MAKRDYYDVLGVEKGATTDAIRKAFKKQAMEHHPDRNRHDPKSEARFKEVNEAYDVLKDDQKKAAYDRFGHAAFENGHGASAGAGGFRPGGADFSSAFSDIFEDLFGMGAAAQRTRSRSQRGSDLRYNLLMTLEEAFHGKQATISVPSSAVCDVCDGTGAEGGAVPATCPTCSGMGKVRAQQGFFTVERTCPTCAGRGQIIKNPCASCNGAGRVARERTLNVNIPAGVETGTRIRLASEGEAGLRGGPAGDLYIFVEVERHPIFERENQDLYCRIPLAMTTATLGGEIDAPTLDGGKTRVKVPSGVQSGKQLRLRGKGMPPLRGTGAGDLYIELAVETPVNLTARQKELLREFEQESRENSPEAQDFFSRVKGFWDGMKG